MEKETNSNEVAFVLRIRNGKISSIKVEFI